MRHLFTIDLHNYDPNGTVEVRPSVRGIVIRGGKVLMVHSLKYDYYKFPGGGMEAGETQKESLCREVLEETGMPVIPDSILEYGLVHRRSKGHRMDLFIQDNYYYLCAVSDPVGQQLDDYEAEERFTPEFVTPEQAIHVNLHHDHQGQWGVVVERDSRILQMLVDEGYVQ